MSKIHTMAFICPLLYDSRATEQTKMEKTVIESMKTEVYIRSLGVFSSFFACKY